MTMQILLTLMIDYGAADELTVLNLTLRALFSRYKADYLRNAKTVEDLHHFYLNITALSADCLKLKKSMLVLRTSNFLGGQVSAKSSET